MHCRYGTFNFHPWECSLSISRIAMMSGRGFKRGDNITLTFDFEIVEAGPAAVETRLQAISNAFNTEGLSCGLVDDSGNPVPSHWLQNTASNSANITNVQVISRKLPPTINGEFVSGRKGQIVVASFFSNPNSQVIEFSDRITRHGNAGPEFAWRRDDRLPLGWYPERTAPSSLQALIQSGHAIGESSWPLPPPPLYLPPFEDSTKRVITHSSPQRFPEGYLGFRVDWQYHYTLPTFDDVTGPYIF